MIISSVKWGQWGQPLRVLMELCKAMSWKPQHSAQQTVDIKEILASFSPTMWHSLISLFDGIWINSRRLRDYWRHLVFPTGFADEKWNDCFRIRWLTDCGIDQRANLNSSIRSTSMTSPSLDWLSGPCLRGAHFSSSSSYPGWLSPTLSPLNPHSQAPF